MKTLGYISYASVVAAVWIQFLRGDYTPSEAALRFILAGTICFVIHLVSIADSKGEKK